MAISINWGTSIIYVPKADLTLVQASPEVRELDLDWFRLILKALEDSEDGMPFSDTHKHITESTLAGLTYARQVEILTPYTVEFEDAQYTVNCTGANHNISDKKVANQVSLIVNNAAGLISNALIEYSAFNGGVTIDVVNGVAGTVGSSTNPIGTPKNPSGVIEDAITIANNRGFTELFIVGNATFGAGHSLPLFNIKGNSHVQNVITVEDAADVTNCVFEDVEIDGVMDGDNEMNECIIGTLTYFSGHIHDSGLIGTVTLAGLKASVFSDCKTIDPYLPPSINMGGTGQDLAMPNYSGLLFLENMSSGFAGIGLLSGQVVLKSTITGGLVHVSGSGVLVDEAGDSISSGTWNGTTIINTLSNPESIAEAVLNTVTI